MLRLISRDGILESSPPMRRTATQNMPTLLVSWWCTIFALVIILTRVSGRYVRTERLFREDVIMFLSIIPLMIRMGLVHVILIWGTNNTTLIGITEEEIHHRETGAKLVLASRIFYAMFIWTAKLTVSEFLKRITENTWSRKQEIGLKIIRGFLAITFIGVVVGTLAECQPFDHYWQVRPDPGPKCRNGYAQLLTMGVSDIITDLLLIFFPMPVIITSTMPVMRKISLCLLFSLSFILLAIAAYRMPAIIAVHGLQQRRSLWASIEILAAAAVANSVVIGSFIKDKGVKKSKFKNENAIQRTTSADPSINRTMTRQHWGDDEDEELFRSLGGRLNSVADGDGKGPIPRAPAMVEPVPSTDFIQDMKGNDWPLKNPEPTTASSRSQAQQADDPSNEMALLDVGGILGNGSPPSPETRYRTPDDSIVTQDFANSPRQDLSMRSSDDSSVALSPRFQARGGAQEPRITTSRQRRTPDGGPLRAENLRTSNGRPAETHQQLELSDAGGLLS